jgi:hypothetical protein
VSVNNIVWIHKSTVTKLKQELKLKKEGIGKTVVIYLLLIESGTPISFTSGKQH